MVASVSNCALSRNNRRNGVFSSSLTSIRRSDCASSSFDSSFNDSSVWKKGTVVSGGIFSSVGVKLTSPRRVER